MFRIGHGFDAHRLVEAQPFVLGGVKIDFSKGAIGHSDADVLIHAVCDALLGAAGLRDIGFHFPDNDERYRGIDSRLLLRETVKMIQDKQLVISNLDCTIALQEPKISKYIPEMQVNLAADLGIDVSFVNVKATTTEHLGFTGRGEGVAVWAVTILYPVKDK
ncbi:MAG: 2-C-methyl-D-erythritol 2,4-cyclodiphosphate synthase [Chloroflexota bacterium]|nr:2-C-methyl-D-erythritol 2,4-cyclodiphosphate synthase [Bacteroidales bacterium]HLO89809.1 2-C-methyl-D-erythritol 2,4-cyclodiphosphate synthase [Lentimicrobium sp.]